MADPSAAGGPTDPVHSALLAAAKSDEATSDGAGPGGGRGIESKHEKKARMGFVSYWTDWLGMTGLITSLITVLIIIMAFFYAYFDDINWGIFYMSCASLVGIFASMAIWFRRVEEDGCDPCVKSILQKVAKDAADKAVASYGAKAE